MGNDSRVIRLLMADLSAREGWSVHDGGKHVKIYPPNQQNIIVLARTPSDWRWRRNLRSELRRVGWPGTVLD